MSLLAGRSRRADEVVVEALDVDVERRRLARAAQLDDVTIDDARDAIDFSIVAHQFVADRRHISGHGVRDLAIFGDGPEKILHRRDLIVELLRRPSRPVQTALYT